MFPTNNFSTGYIASRKRQAANMISTENPEYTIKDFLSFFPHFENQLDFCIIQNYIDEANNSVNIGRWGKKWKRGMALYVAHLCVLHSQMVGPDPENPTPISNNSVVGVVSSESVGGVSISYDTGSVLSGTEGWHDMGLTTYGLQFIRLAKEVTTPFMVIS